MKLKIHKDKKRVRKFYLRTQEDRTALVQAIIQAQGYASQLEQYTIEDVLDRSAESCVMKATHKALKKKFVIKAIPSQLYHSRSTSIGISEVDV